MRLLYKEFIRIWENIPIPIFLATIIGSYYSLLIFFYLPNKLIFLLTCFLIVSLLLKLKNLSFALVYSFFITSVIYEGKKYNMIIVPPGIFPLDEYPLGYFIQIAITPSFMIACFIGLVFIREWIRRSYSKITLSPIDYIFIAGYFLRLVSNVIMSPQVNTSIILWIFSLPQLLVYLFIRSAIKPNHTTLKRFFIIIISLFSIESLIAIIQFIHGGPLGLSIESQNTIEQFGQAADEYVYRFRSIGTFDHANMLGAYLSVHIAIILNMINKKISGLKLLILLLGLTAIGLTISRSAWISLFFISLYYWQDFRRMTSFVLAKLHTVSVILCVTLCILFSTFIIYPRITASFFSFSEEGGGALRNEQIEISKKLIFRSPLLGTGMGMSVPLGLEYDFNNIITTFAAQVHNRYILIAVENGIPAVLLTIFFVTLSAKNIYAITHNKKEKTGIFKVYVSAVTASVVIALFQPYNLEIYIAMLYAFIHTYES